LLTHKVSIGNTSIDKCLFTARLWLPLGHWLRGWYWLCQGGC